MFNLDMEKITAQAAEREAVQKRAYHQYVEQMSEFRDDLDTINKYLDEAADDIDITLESFFKLVDEFLFCRESGK